MCQHPVGCSASGDMKSTAIASGTGAVKHTRRAKGHGHKAMTQTSRVNTTEMCASTSNDYVATRSTMVKRNQTSPGAIAPMDSSKQRRRSTDYMHGVETIAAMSTDDGDVHSSRGRAGSTPIVENDSQNGIGGYSRIACSGGSRSLHASPVQASEMEKSLPSHGSFLPDLPMSSSFFTYGASQSPTKLRHSPVRLQLGAAPAYAGAKFSDPPSPKVLPRPPTHWVGHDNISSMSGSLHRAGVRNGDCVEMTNVLKVMLNVQC